MLTAYLNQTRRLLQNPPAPTSLYTDADLTLYINTARGQVAGEGECIRTIGTINTVVGQRNYNFRDIDIGNFVITGIRETINVRRISYNVGTGQQWVQPRNWEWFDLYGLNNPVPSSGPPTMWAQYAQGAAGTVVGTGDIAQGSFYINPLPDIVYVLNCDCTCSPAFLVDDTSFEAIPYLWTDAVPFFAAYYALLSSQTSARQADANRMYEAYQTFMERARKAANPSVNRWLYQQAADPTMIAKLGLQQKAGANG